jgi:hypothetical protein
VIAATSVAILMALLSTVSSFPSDSVFTWDEWRSVFVGQLLAFLVSSVVFVSLALFATRYLSQGRMATIVTAIAALGLGLFLAGSGNLLLAPTTCAAAVVMGLVALGVRRLRGGGEAGTVERLLRVSAIGLLPGALATQLPFASIEAVANLSVLLLGFLLGATVLGLIPLAMAGFVAMRRSVEWFIAIRYLVAQRRQVFISAITAICVGGIAAGVWLIIVVLSVMNGFEQTWRDEILGNRAHFTVHSSFGPFVDEKEILSIVESVPGVEAASP